MSDDSSSCVLSSYVLLSDDRTYDDRTPDVMSGVAAVFAGLSGPGPLPRNAGCLAPARRLSSPGRAIRLVRLMMRLDASLRLDGSRVPRRSVGCSGCPPSPGRAPRGPRGGALSPGSPFGNTNAGSPGSSGARDACWMPAGSGWCSAARGSGQTEWPAEWPGPAGRPWPAGGPAEWCAARGAELGGTAWGGGCWRRPAPSGAPAPPAPAPPLPWPSPGGGGGRTRNAFFP